MSAIFAVNLGANVSPKWLQDPLTCNIAFPIRFSGVERIDMLDCVEE